MTDGIGIPPQPTNRRALNAPLSPEELLPQDMMPGGFRNLPTERQKLLRLALCQAIQSYIGEPAPRKEIVRRAEKILAEKGIK